MRERVVGAHRDTIASASKIRTSSSQDIGSGGKMVDYRIVKRMFVHNNDVLPPTSGNAPIPCLGLSAAAALKTT